MFSLSGSLSSSSVKKITQLTKMFWGTDKLRCPASIAQQAEWRWFGRGGWFLNFLNCQILIFANLFIRTPQLDLFNFPSPWNFNNDNFKFFILNTLFKKDATYLNFDLGMVLLWMLFTGIYVECIMAWVI